MPMPEIDGMVQPAASGLHRWVESFLALIADTAESKPLHGYVLIALALLLENVIPPIPSELVMPLSGFLIQQGKLQFVPVVLAALIGTLLGACFWYGVGRLVNEQRLEHLIGRHGRWFGLRPADLAASRRWFSIHGPAVVFWGRMIPGIRPFVSIPAGIELMPQGAFLFWTSAGSLIWILVLVSSGMVLGANYRQILLWIAPMGSFVVQLLLVLIASIGVWMLVRQLRKNSR